MKKPTVPTKAQAVQPATLSLEDLAATTIDGGTAELSIADFNYNWEVYEAYLIKLGKRR